MENSDLNRFYNKDYYNEHEFSYTFEDRQDIKRILDFIGPSTDLNVLEIGCGLGVLLSKIPSKKKLGIETNDYAINVCKQRGLRVIKGDVDNGLKFGGDKFDVIIMNEVLSHINNPKKVLRECYRELGDNGKLLVTSPVRSWFFHDISETHLHEFNVNELRNLISDSGFRVISHEVSGVSFLYPVMENLIFRPGRWLRKMLPSTEVSDTDVNEVKAKTQGGLLSYLQQVADQTIFKPLGVYRKSFLNWGLNQLIYVEKKEYC